MTRRLVWGVIQVEGKNRQVKRKLGGGKRKRVKVRTTEIGTSGSAFNTNPD